MNRNHVAMVLWLLLAAAPLQAQTEEPIRETVSVVNVEVPVRVFAAGRPVSGLAKEDFTIREDGKEQPINGFAFFQKRMNPAAALVRDGRAAEGAGRHFVLVFRTYECNEPLENGLRFLFSDVLRPEDQLLVMANNRTLQFERLGDDAGTEAKLLELLRSESVAARNQMLNFVRSIEQALNMTKFRTALRGGGRAGIGSELSAEYLTNFLDNYLKAWQEFKRRYLRLELEKFYYFARHLERIRREKWVLNFYQLEQFPQIAFDSDIDRQLREYIGQLAASDNPTQKVQSRTLERQLQSIHREMNVADDFPAAEASKLFYKVNATFHSFFMRTFLSGDSADLQFRSVATDIENSLRALTETTGGTLVSSNDLDQALAAAGDKSDEFYVLTYEPTHPKKVGKIKVTVKGGDYKVLYDNNIRADYIRAYLERMEAENPAVKITGLSFRDRKLSFVIRDYSRPKKGAPGLLTVRIRVRDEDGESRFDQSKALQAEKDTFSLSLTFSSLGPGRYDVIVDVLDQVSGKTCSEIVQPLVR
ncbi:MAG: hypothetical protein JXO51_10340 [Candidatus Aminicenantes bacterium]|nr:hypothetical protein [Candidatus Aminicenantes bacterium]